MYWGVESVCCSERRAPAGARIALRNKASKLLERRKKNPLFRFNYCSFRVMQLGDIPRGERLTVGAPYKKQSLSRQPVGKAGRLGWWRANSRQAASSGLLCTLRSQQLGVWAGGRSEPSVQGKPPLQLDSPVSRWQFLGAALAHQERVPLATRDQDVVVNRSD